MALRSVSPEGLRSLALAAGVAGALLAPVGLSAQAAEGPTAPPGTAPSTDPGAAGAATAPGAGATVQVVPPGSPIDPSQDVPPPGAPQPVEPQPSAAAPTDPQPTSMTVSRASASGSKSVSIVDFAFQPGSITVNSGDTVVWTNDGEVPEGHDVTGDGPDSGLMKSGDTYSHTFNSAGTFSYICTIHPSMKGSVRVLARSGGGGSGASGESGGDASESGSTASGSESAAVASPGAAGSSSSLPATGSDTLWLVIPGLALVGVGLALRVLRPHREGRRP